MFYPAQLIEKARANAQKYPWAAEIQKQVVAAAQPWLKFSIDLSEHDFYVIDIFRVVGGSEHTKFLHSHFGQITTRGLTLQPAEPYGHNTQMRNFQMDPNPQPGWSVDWKIEDRYKYLPPGSELHLRYTDLTQDAQAYIAEGWISIGGYNASEEIWIPRVMVRRQTEGERDEAKGEREKGTDELASTFVGVLEPYEKMPFITQARRLSLQSETGTPSPDSNVALEITLTSGERDLFVVKDVESTHHPTPNTQPLTQKEWGLQTDGELCFVRQGRKGEIKHLVLCGGSFLQVGEARLQLKEKGDFVEVEFQGGRVGAPNPVPPRVYFMR